MLEPLLRGLGNSASSYSDLSCLAFIRRETARIEFGLVLERLTEPLRQLDKHYAHIMCKLQTFLIRLLMNADAQGGVQ